MTADKEGPGLSPSSHHLFIDYSHPGFSYPGANGRAVMITPKPPLLWTHQVYSLHRLHLHLVGDVLTHHGCVFLFLFLQGLSGSRRRPSSSRCSGRQKRRMRSRTFFASGSRTPPLLRPSWRKPSIKQARKMMKVRQEGLSSSLASCDMA